MKYPEDYINKIICGDCLEVMKCIPDKAVDLVLTDPPYGLGLDYGGYDDTQENLSKLVNTLMPELLRIGKRVALTCGVQNVSLYPQPKWMLIWHYRTTNTRCSWGFNQYQPILVWGKDPYLENCMGARSDLIESTEVLKEVTEFHPCPKPKNTWVKILKRCSVKDTDIILDPFSGSGTTAVVCKELGRKFIGIEINPKYCEIAQRRLAQEYLFT